MTTTTTTSMCRLCTALCPIVVTVDDGRAVEVHGDRDAPLFGGYTCPKGRALPEIHSSPERLLHSLKRRPDGSYEPITNEQLVAEVADRLADIVERHGPRSVAMYTGTSNIAYPTMGGMAAAMLRALGSTMFFSAATIDQPGIMIANAVHGLWLGGRNRLEDADAWLFVGTNPVISKQFIGENPARQLHHAVERGMKLLVIDPRRTETARLAHVHLQPRPNEDATLVAAILHVLLREGMVDSHFVAENVDGLDELRRAVAPFTPEYAAARADVPVDDLVEAARLLGRARRGGTGGGTGVSMTSRSSLVSYLLLCIDSVRGFHAREGDRVERPNVLLPPNPAKAQAFAPYRAWDVGAKLRVRGLGQTVAGLPTGALAEEILTPGEGQIRALFNAGGSPMMAWPDQRRTQEALADLELFVTTDVWHSPTARAAHYVAATKMTFETPGMTQVTEGIKYHNIAYGFSEPYAQYTPALLDPPAGSDLIEDWQLFYRVGQRLGLSMSWLSVFGSPLGYLEAPLEPIPLDMDHEPTTDELFEIMCRGSNVPLAEVKRHPHGHVFEHLQEQRVAPRDTGCEARLDVGNADLLAELHAIGSEDYVTVRERAAERPFLLVPRRENRVINSTGRNLPGLMRGRRYNPAFMSPVDLSALGLTPGDTVCIRSEHDAIVGIVEADHDLRPGVVSMSHGFGANPGEHEDPRVDGANTNRLLRADADYDPITGMPRMGALPVSVTALAG
ncbi:MAG TPA: molybdopterin-dependent oxidoreductase [Acidimicrobiia bacterium]|nr:molybdopterin-dependent oxidoreductase [Acidimicrobiia bacterium]